MARDSLSPGAPALASASRVLEGVIFRGQSLEVARQLAAPAAETPAVRAITLGTLRWYLRLAPALERLQHGPHELEPPLKALLAAAAHQVVYSRNRAEVSANAAVDAARILGLGRASGLVNAVMRRFVRERAALFAELDESLAVSTAHPAWLVERLLAHWPEEARTILSANNEHPPMVLRVDRSRTSVADCLAQLRRVSIDAQPIQWSDAAIILTRPMPVGALPGFAEGLLSVQDAGAQLAAGLLDPKPGERVLDACAAPGGKTGALLERGGEIELTALDVTSERIALVEENLARLHRRAHTVAADLRRPETFWDGRPYQRILLDAPCSSTGVIRRHPDIKLLRRPTDIATFAELQRSLLTSALSLLAPGGRLLYGTCSVLPEENEDVVRQVLGETPGVSVAEMRVLSGPPGARARSAGLQLLPGAEAGTDGFYYACLEKTTAGT